MEGSDILIVDDDENLNFALHETLTRRQFKVERAFSYLEGKEKIQYRKFPLVITDVRMPDGNGIDLVAEIKSRSPQSAVIVITAFGRIEDAVTALKNGASDYIQKPFSVESLLKLVEQYFPERFQQLPAGDFLTHSPMLTAMLEKARRAARSNAAVLIRGESGSGKEVLARYIHRNSPRSDQPYIALNCAAIPENLLESELFGYEKGAFTGAEKMKPGKFELADKGTLVLDEIGDMPLHLQAKILRVLQEREVDRLGGRKALPVDVRVISLTNQAIEEKIRAKSFREDLFFRLNVVEFHLPPLRERGEDIPYLARHFVELYSRELGRDALALGAGAARKLGRHHWPGNIRELQNVLHKAVIFSDGREIGEEDIEFSALPGEPPAADQPQTVAGMEKELILRTLERTGNNRNRAAEILGISARTLRNKLKEYSIADESES